MIEPKLPKGFRDSLPNQEIKRKFFEQKLENTFESYGFVPIDTPILEYTEVLLGKGGGETDKQIFHFTDNGGREVALRFDLTVPLARFVSAHRSEIELPFKRYHIAKVFRGEKPQKGRYREFVQCDFDIVGVDNAQSDAEILSMMISSMQVLDVGGFRIHVSNRALLNDFLSTLGIQHKSSDVLRAIDKLAKIGIDNVKAELAESGVSENQTDLILSFINPVSEDYIEVLNHLVSLIGKETEGAVRMRQIWNILKNEGVQDFLLFDPSITRGLDYYTGVVYETLLDSNPQIGSVCSGGRYNNLTGLYSKENLPGVGSCVGIDRLIAAQEEIDSTIYPSVDVVIFACSDVSPEDAASYGQSLRKLGIRCDAFLGERKIRDQYDYAQSKGAGFAILSLWGEKADLKNLATREITTSIGADEAARLIRK